LTGGPLRSRQRRIDPAIRRGIDLVVVLLAAPLVAPLLGLLALVIRLETPGPIFARHERLGQGGSRFVLYKLRTMVRDAEERKRELVHLNVLPWPDFKIPRDPRVTRAGRLLRRSSLDELPQLWNLFRGEITLVGPRPCSIELENYALWQTERLEAKPGLFGRWQAEARGNADFAARCRLDIDQIRRRNVLREVRLAFQSVFAVLSGRGAS
jgi:lipopolysaccharide/colanic/teichoic acid biosynthesis glycosyltransferase